MTSTLFSTWSALAPVQDLLRWLVGNPPPARNAGTRPVRQDPGMAVRTVARAAVCGRRRTLPRARTRPSTAPLRVVQVLDAGPAPAPGGRMRIYGRMADVCAELDRMVEREASFNASS